jgi:hypothetical protein
MTTPLWEQRRTGPINVLRRQLYSLALLSSTLAAEAADNPLHNPAAPPRRLPVAETSSAPWSDNDVLMTRNAHGAGWMAYGGMAALNSNARLFSRDYAYLPVGELLFTAHFLGDDLSTLRKGMGVDLAIPEFGYVHLNLYSGRDGPNRGKRWRVNPDGMALPESHDRFWSLGGSLDLVKPDRNSRRQIVFVPQLILNVDQIATIPGHMQMSMTYSRWNSPVSGLLQESGTVPQVSFKWAY